MGRDFDRMPVIAYQENKPQIGPECFIAPDAWVIGKAEIGDHVSIFFGAVIRGDIQAIKIGSGSNLQEHVMLHTSHGLQDCIVGEDVTVGHRAIIHGCTVRSSCIIGMGSVILDGSEIGEESIVGAQALVPMNTKFPPRSMIMGVPAKWVRELKPDEIKAVHESAAHYKELGKYYRKVL